MEKLLRKIFSQWGTPALLRYGQETKSVQVIAYGKRGPLVPDKAGYRQDARQVCFLPAGVQIPLGSRLEMPNLCCRVCSVEDLGLYQQAVCSREEESL